MVATMLTLVIFVLSFIVFGFTYIMLVNLKILKKKKIEKVARLIGVYSLFLALVYVFYHMYM